MPIEEAVGRGTLGPDVLRGIVDFSRIEDPSLPPIDLTQDPRDLVPHLCRLKVVYGLYDIWTPDPIRIAKHPGVPRSSLTTGERIPGSEDSPLHPLAGSVCDRIISIITDPAVGCQEVPFPDEETPEEEIPDLVIVAGTENPDWGIDVMDMKRSLRARGGDWVPSILYIGGEPIEEVSLTSMRKRGVQHSCHMNTQVNGKNGQLEKAAWGSFPGNHKLIQGSAEAVLRSLVWRTLTNGASRNLARRVGTEVIPGFSWVGWEGLSARQELWRSAQDLGRAGIIEEKIVLEDMAPWWKWTERALSSNDTGVGESMGAILCPKDGFAVLTMTGGMKLSFSHDADTGHTPPVVGITQEGYIVGLPEESPIDFRFSPSSESWMTVAIYLALAWAAKGEIRSYQGFQAKLAHEFEKSEGRIYLKDHIPPDFPPVAVRHIHRQPNWIGFNRFRDFPGVEFVNPVCDVTPPLDFTCGRKGEADAILRLLLSSPISGNIDHNLWLDDLAHGAVIVAPTMEEATKTAIKVPTRRPETV